MSISWTLRFAAACAGAVSGLFGAGGGMILVPLLSKLSALSEEDIFPASLSIILPVCIVSLAVTAADTGLDLKPALPYLIGGGIGGTLAGLWSRKIPVIWLHRGLGVLILWGGVNNLL